MIIKDLIRTLLGLSLLVDGTCHAGVTGPLSAETCWVTCIFPKKVHVMHLWFDFIWLQPMRTKHNPYFERLGHFYVRLFDIICKCTLLWTTVSPVNLNDNMLVLREGITAAQTATQAPQADWRDRRSSVIDLLGGYSRSSIYSVKIWSC